MKAHRLHRIPSAIGIGLLLFWVAVYPSRIASALTPESPKVKEAVRKAVEFLESEAAKDDRVGARALVGLVMLKNRADAKHPRVFEAVTAIQNAVKDRKPIDVNLDIYSTGLSIIFLVALNPSAYSSEIVCLLDSLRLRQKKHGGWGYPEKRTGDTSMTQYGVLSAWEARQAGFRTSQKSIESVSGWLMSTQDPSGAFGYQGTVAKSNALVKQSDVRHSMAAAGIGSLFICADLLGFLPHTEKRDEDLPSALKPVKEEPPKDTPKSEAKVDARRLKAAQVRGNHWMTAHYDIDPKEWTYYYLYALERYQSFRELAEGKPEKEPKWYTDGAQFLIDNQQDDGSWQVEGQAGITADTAFATLFLLRSSKKSIEKAFGFGVSTSVVGRGLPRETAEVMVADGRVMPAPEWKKAEELAPILQKSEGPRFEKGVAALRQLSPKETELLIARHADLLQRLAKDSSPEVRTAVMVAFGRGGDIDPTPLLIEALDDPDESVVFEACDALRRLSRSPGPGPVTRHLNKTRRREEIQHWKQWYQAICPEAEFNN